MLKINVDIAVRYWWSAVLFFGHCYYYTAVSYAVFKTQDQSTGSKDISTG